MILYSKAFEFVIDNYMINGLDFCILFLFLLLFCT